MKRDFYFQDDRSNKFWSIELQGGSFTTWHGRVGASPRETRKHFESDDEARREFEKLVAEKLRKGYVEGSAPESSKLDWKSMPMSDEVFWRIIGLFNWKKTGNDDAVIEPAVRALSQMTTNDICQFEDIMAQRLFALDTQAHAENIGQESYSAGRYFSADWFLYARCCVVANGKDYYESVLATASNMPKDLEFESLLSVAANAFERKTGMPFDHQTSVSYESFSNTAEWPSLGH